MLLPLLPPLLPVRALLLLLPAQLPAVPVRAAAAAAAHRPAGGGSSSSSSNPLAGPLLMLGASGRGWQ